MNIIEKPPFNVEIDGILYTHNSSTLPDKYRLPSDILVNIINNICNKAKEENTSVYLEHLSNNMYELFIEDEVLSESYCVDLHKVEIDHE